MKLYRIFIPKKYNGGTLIPIEKTTRILNEVEEKFGGYTLDPFWRMPLVGIWNDPKDKQRYKDEVQIFRVICRRYYEYQKMVYCQKRVMETGIRTRRILYHGSGCRNNCVVIL